MNIFDVRVNRAPCDAQLVRRVYRPGRFVNASFNKADEDNERMALRFSIDNDGQSGRARRGAGCCRLSLAPRIVCHIDDGAEVRAGEQIEHRPLRQPGRCLPAKRRCAARLAGQRIIGGETVIADLRSQEPQHLGEVR